MNSSLPYLWRHLPERLDPVFLRLGPLEVRYYGLAYLLAFGVVYILSVRRARAEKLPYTPDMLQGYLAGAMLAVIAGGRLGYVLIYDLSFYLRRPLEIFLPFSFEGGFHYTGLAGMSYHGGLAGFLLFTVFYCRRTRQAFWGLADFLSPSVALGYTFGRLGNFLNGELYGRPTSAAWGMVFPGDPSGALRHPSQLYEAFLEGLLIFAILWPLRRRKPFEGFLASLYIILYGCARFAAEFFREPDPQLGFVMGPFTMGQILSAAMTAAGVLLMARLAKTAPGGMKTGNG